jgi:hypothetical protein
MARSKVTFYITATEPGEPHGTGQSQEAHDTLLDSLLMEHGAEDIKIEEEKEGDA